MKLYLILPFLLLISLCLHAQKVDAVKSKIKFSSINQLGLISGSQGESTLIETINGVKRDTWFAGVGVAFDFYGERGVPLFLDVRKELMHKKATPFIYADGGVNLEWLNFIQREQRGIPVSYPGAYYDFGAGWKFGNKNNGGFLISAGYSFKQSKEKADQQIYNPVTRTVETSTYSTNYNYRRFVLKIGFQL
jgi:hypothetical protein